MKENYTLEEQSIIDQAQATGTYLKAPNGEDTNLTSEQWVYVRTAAFKRWFAVVHITGEHIRVQILYQLERPVLAFTEIIVKVDALLDNPQTNTEAIVVNQQIIVRNSRLVGIKFTEFSCTANRKQQHPQQVYINMFFLHHLPSCS